MPRVLTGGLHHANKNAFEWGWHGLVAYGCQSTVVILDPRSVKVVQALEGHRSPVTKVRWAIENYPHEHRNAPYHLRLASADEGGQIIIWDAVTALERCTFGEGNGKQITDVRWLPWQGLSKDFLLALHPPYSIVLWNADTGEKLWKKSYTDILGCLDLDPFNHSNLAFLTQSGALMLVDDFSVRRIPSGNGQLFRVSNLTSTASSGNLHTSAVNTPSAESAVRRGGGAVLSGGARLIRKPLMQAFRVVSDKRPEDTPSQSSSDENSSPCLHINYHPAVKNVILLTYAREVLFLETQSMQTISHVAIDRAMSPFSQVLPCSQRDAVFFAQENGCVSFRLQKLKISGAEINFDNFNIDVYNPVDTVYEILATSENLRVMKSYRVFAVQMSPVSQRQLAILMSNGRVLFYDLVGESEPRAETSLRDLIDFSPNLKQTAKSKMRFVLSGLHSSLGQMPTVARARPIMHPDSTSNRTQLMSDAPERNLIAVGTADGTIQLVDVATNQIHKDFSVHSCAIRCLEWGGSNHVISAGYAQTLSTSTVVRNELFSTDIRTGLTKNIRPESDESPIEMLRVSFYHTYLAVSFRDQPLEIWDVKHFRLLRRMSRACPIIVDMAWSGKHHKAHLVQTSEDLGAPVEILQNAAETKTHQAIYRENLVVLDNETHLYHVVVKGMHVRDGKEVNTQWATTSQINSMVWKDDYLAFGDADGKLSVWDLATKQSKASSYQRGGVKRLQFSRVPADYTLIVMHTDGVALWNAKTCTHLHQLTYPKGLAAKVIDVDLCGSDRLPVVLTTDGCLRLFDRSLSVQSSPIHDAVLTGIFCPAILPPSTVFVLKTVFRDSFACQVYGISDVHDVLAVLDATELNEGDKHMIHGQLDSLDEWNERENSLVDGAELVARLVGDEWEARFWSVVKYSCALISGDKHDIPDPSLYMLWENELFKKRELRRCACFDARRASYDQLSAHVTSLAHLRQLENAVQLLLNTDPTQPEYYADCLKACLLSSMHSSTECQSTVKLVATNLIACGKIQEGTQLLSLIDKSVDACKYLQSNSDYYMAAWLAKIALSGSDCSDILKKWADYLCGPQICFKSFGLLLLVMLQEWKKAIDLLIGMKQFGNAALLLQKLNETNIPEDKNIPSDVQQVIYSEYARELQTVGMAKLALHYCKLGGERGANIAKEIQILNGDM